MRILFVIPTMRMGGAEKSLCNLLNRIPEGEDDISLLLFSKEGELLSEIPHNVKVYSLSDAERAMVLEWRLFHKALLHPFQVKKLLRRVCVLIIDHIQRLTKTQAVDTWRIIEPVIAPFSGKYDLAIGYLEGTADFYTLEKITATKKIGWIHTDFRINKKNVKDGKKYYQRFDRLATITESCRLSIVSLMPEVTNKIDIVSNINDQVFIERLSKEFNPFVESDEYQLITVGRLEDEKGIDLAIDTAAELIHRRFNFKWHVYGDGSRKKQLTQRIIDKNLTGIFILEGTVKNPYPYMRYCDIVVQPSRYEGKSIVLDEAKMLCKPIVVTNYPTAQDQIVDGETGIITGFQPTSIADAIMNICMNQEAEEQLSNGCKMENASREDGYRAFMKLVENTFIQQNKNVFE